VFFSPYRETTKIQGCDFAGLGPHSFRRANITWRQEVGGSAIEASKIAGHSDLEMTNEYTFVAPERQNELTRRIQKRLADATESGEGGTQPTCEMTDTLRKLEELAPITPNLQ
jgi:hypothetical protein